jgi:hypothetical protein
MERRMSKLSSLGALFAAITACTAAAACLVGSRAAVAAEAVPLAGFGRHASLEDVVISPDGNKIAFVRTNGDSRNLAVATVTNSEVLGGVHVGEAKGRRSVAA